MATINDPLLNGMRGKLGKYVFFQLNGKTVVRSMPLTVKNPKTPVQEAQRSRFKDTVAYLRQLTALIRITWLDIPRDKIPFNQAVSYNSKNAWLQVDGLWKLNPPAIKHAKGSLLNADDYTVINPNGVSIIINWFNNAGRNNALDSDTFCYICYNITQNKVLYFLTDTKRSESSYSFCLPNNWSGCDVAFYAFFKGQDKNAVSNDTYIGSLSLLSV